jgi:hypothetical protein
MIRAAPLILLLCLALPGAASRADAAQLSYTTYVVAVPVVDAVLTVDLTAATYRTALGFHTIGIANLFANSLVDDHVTGRLEGDQATPAEYSSKVRLHGEDRFVGMIWRDGTPTVTALTRGSDDEREDVPAASRAHTIDPLSALTRLLRLIDQTGRCDASSQTYNGRRLQSFVLKTAGEEDIAPSNRSSFSGRGLRCDFTERTIAGFRLDSRRDAEAREHHGTVWLSRIIPGGPRLPVRASFETPWFGDATTYLTAATP